MVRGAWWAIVHGVAKSQTQLSMHTNTYTHTHTHTYTHTHRVKGAGRLAEFEIHEILALLVAQSVKNLPAVQETIRDTNSILELGRSPGGGSGDPLLYSCLENSMVRGAWWAIVHGIAKSWTQLSI